jgi:hypothetical protein
MKTKRELQRKRRWFGFNSIDPRSGYDLRYTRGKDGTWWYVSETTGANGFGSTLSKAKKDAGWFIPWFVADCAADGMPLPPPDREPVCQ